MRVDEEIFLFYLALTAGWVLGSFLNQVVDRSPFRVRSPLPGPREHPRAPDGRPLTLLHPPRSVCLTCGTSIPWYRNVPVLSWILLRGRCASCGAQIGWRTLLVELATPLGFAVIITGWLREALAAAQTAGSLLAWSGAMVVLPCLLEGRRPHWSALLALALGFFTSLPLLP